MEYPIKFALRNGTAVEVSPSHRAGRFVFDLYKNGNLFDSFTWTPDTQVRKEDMGVTDTAALSGRYAEALETFQTLLP